MSVDQTDKIDLIGTSAYDQQVILTIADHLEWDEQGEHIVILQDKINAYLHFIESGQLFEEYPGADSRELVICVTLKYEPDETGLEFLNLCRPVILDAGIVFEWQTLEPED